MQIQADPNPKHWFGRFGCKNAAGAALKKAAPALGSDQQKVGSGSGSTLKVAAPGRLRNTAKM